MNKVISIQGHLSKLYVSIKSNYAFYIFLLFYVSILLFLGNTLTLWEDEAFSLSTSANPILKVINLSYFFEGQPPVYFTLLALWRKIDDSILFARFLSIFCSLVSAFVLNKTLRLLFPKYYSKWIIVLFLLNPFTIWASLEIRLYSLLVLFSLTLLYFFFQVFYFKKLKYRIWFVIVGILGVYTQYYFVFLIMSLSVLVLVSKGWKPLFDYCLTAFFIALAFIPNLFFIGDQLTMHEETQHFYPWHSRICSILYSPMHFLFAINELDLGVFVRWSILLFVGLLFTVLLIKLFLNYRKGDRDDFQLIIRLLVPIAVLLVIFNVLFSISNLFYTHRYLTIIFPFYCLLLPLLGIYSKKVSKLLYGTLATIYLVLMVYIYSPPFIKGPHVPAVVNYIQKNAINNEPVLFRDKSLVLVFQPYFLDNNRLVPLRELSFNFNYYRDEIKDTTELGRLIEEKTKDNSSFIFISGHDEDFVANKELTNCEMDKFISDNYKLLSDTVINGRYDYNYLKIRKLKKK